MKLKSLLFFFAGSILIAATLLEILPALTNGHLSSAVYGRESTFKSGVQAAEYQKGALLREAVISQKEADVRLLIERTEENLFRAGSFGFDNAFKP